VIPHFGWRGQFIPSKRTPLPFTIIDNVRPYCESYLSISGLELAIDHSVNFARQLPHAKYLLHNQHLEKWGSKTEGPAFWHWPHISVGGGIQSHCDNVLTPPSRRRLLRILFQSHHLSIQLEFEPAEGAGSVSCTTTRHIEYRAGVETAGFGTQPCNKVRDLLGRSKTLHWAISDHLFNDVSSKVADHVRVDGPRRDAIDKDVSCDHFPTERFRERDYPCPYQKLDLGCKSLKLGRFRS
jgi:hypothetical protein